MENTEDLDKVKRLSWSDVCKEHDNLSQVLEYADSTKEEIRAAAVSVCLALNGIHEQLRRAAQELKKDERLQQLMADLHNIHRHTWEEAVSKATEELFRKMGLPINKALCSSPPVDTPWEQDRKDLLECESILSSIVDFVNVWSRESSLPEIQSAGQITKALDKLWSRASFRDVTMQSTLSQIASNAFEDISAKIAIDGLRAVSAGELLWIQRKPPEFDPSKYDAQGNAKPSTETPHKPEVPALSRPASSSGYR